MLKILFITLIFVSSLFANKVIYFNYDDIPKRVINGEIFTITLKTISTIKDFDDIKYTFSNQKGLEILDEEPIREKKGKYFFDTFHLLVKNRYARLPDITASIVSFDEYPATTIFGKKLNVITLNPKDNFSNVIANSFELISYKTTTYNKNYNIVIFKATAKNANLNNIHFKNVYKQGIESINNSYEDGKVIYFVVIDKKLENFTFSYFNLLKNRFELLNIPIVVDDDSVTTQSDLKPRDQSHDKIKIYIASALIIFLAILILWRKKYIYFIILTLPLGYIIYLIIPQKEICIKEGTKIHLLPVDNGTIFETTKNILYLPKEGNVDKFIKVKLKNEKIGWVRDEDTCTY